MIEARKRHCGHPKCSISEGIHERLTFGRGALDNHGFWSIPCGICARVAEKTDGKEEGFYWPHTVEDKKARDPELVGLEHMPEFEACHVLIAEIRKQKPESIKRDQMMNENFRRIYGGTEVSDVEA